LLQTDDLELKKLVYLYLINYAKTQPDLAIMAVNTFVKVGGSGGGGGGAACPHCVPAMLLAIRARQRHASPAAAAAPASAACLVHGVACAAGPVGRTALPPAPRPAG